MKPPASPTRIPPHSASAPKHQPAPAHNGSPAEAFASIPSEAFVNRHIGPTPDDVKQMLATIGVSSLDELIDQTIPAAIRLRQPLNLPQPRGEHELLHDLRAIAAKNQVLRSCIGMGYYGTIVPPVIQRNILENPGWYTQYTPYQAEISQGRLESLLNFQTMVADLTGLPLANASLLDEATAAAEAMAMCVAVSAASPRHAFFVADDCHPQTIHVVQTRGHSMGVQIVVAPIAHLTDGKANLPSLCGALLQYPNTNGHIADHAPLIEHLHNAGVLAVVATDLLALCLLRPPGEFGADIAVGSAQRFGVPLGFGGPHAAFIATRNEFARRLPGRLVGVSRDAAGNPAYRLTLQTREQHIRRDKATSNICTAQALLANMAAMYAVYHGPAGLRQIARRVHALTATLASTLARAGHAIAEGPFFDTIKVRPSGRSAADVLAAARKQGVNLRDFADGQIGISLDETTTPADLSAIVSAFSPGTATAVDLHGASAFPAPLARTSSFLTHPVFNQYHSETEMLRYITRLQSRDLSLAQSMIPLGSCTMKLNATSEMLPVTWPEFADLHPYAPPDQSRGYAELTDQLANWLGEIAGLPACSLQPNAGSQGEYAGLLVIRAFHAARGQGQRDICLIPTSAHGTNPASAVIAGLRVVAVDCDQNGNVDLSDLRKKVDEHRDRLAAIMVTYPSTHGVFEESIRELCQIIHDAGGQVYMDGANMNAQVGLCRPGDIGADVCHLNLHKTFCIPHGGGGPGMGPICVAKHLAPFLPDNPATAPAGKSIGPVSAAPFGSALILTVSWVYIALMGAAGLKRATEIAILSANYMAKRLGEHFPVLFAGRNGRVAHEFILDARQLDKSAAVKVEDIAKRLMDFGFHAPTISFPEAGTLMIEPTESESKRELDRFCDALIAIRHEIREIEEGRADRADNPLKNAPHTIAAVSADNWPHKYPRQQAAFPAPWLHEFKFWPAVARIDNPYGDRNLFCSCPPINADE
jgi:glycine dehydrogenase